MKESKLGQLCFMFEYELSCHWMNNLGLNLCIGFNPIAFILKSVLMFVERVLECTMGIICE